MPIKFIQKANTKKLKSSSKVPESSRSSEFFRMGPFGFLLLIGLLFVQVSLGLELLDCKCYAHENDYRIIGGEPSEELFLADLIVVDLIQ